MENLLQELYKTDIHLEKIHFRKISLENLSYQINGISQSGKSNLVKHYLLGLKKNSYLYIDCNDTRLEVDKLNETLTRFCNANKIDTLVLNHYKANIKIPNVTQLIICSETHFDIDYLTTIELYPL
ncbi:MAG: putative AAA+ superfamily ATPase [Sulfurimonas sp.]|jgi:predicted AAA+ superfamily ATPase